jgi:parallel beta-helix repeat protein
MPSILLRFSAALLILVFSGAALADKYVVTSFADSGAGTLRQAIEDANATPGKDSIVFDLPGAPPHILFLSNPLPYITETVKIDGSGSVVIDGSGIAVSADGLRIVDTDNSSISGLTIRGFTEPLPCDPAGYCLSGAGISIQGSSSENKLSDNRLLGNVNGIIVANGASKNSVKKNFIDGEVGALEPQGGDPLADEVFRTDLRLVNGFPSYGIIIGPGAPDNAVEENHTQRTLRAYVVFLSDQNRLFENGALAHGNQCYLVVGSEDNVVSENSCELTRREAFEIFGDVPFFSWPVSSRNRFAENHASRSGYGDPDIGQLLIQGGTDNVMEDNILVDNFSYGIALFGFSAGNIIRSNEIDGVDRAAILAFGFPGSEVDDNVFVENSLRNYSKASG